MRKWRVLIGLLMLMLLAGCRQTSSQPAASASSSAAPAAKKHSRKVQTKPKAKQKSPKAGKMPQAQTIVSALKARRKAQYVYAPFGDSLSVGLFADSRKTRFTTLFAQDLQRDLGKPVQEKGIAVVGKTAANLGVVQVNALAAQKPDLVTVEFGTNDAVGGAGAQVLAAFKQNLQTILTTLKAKTSAQILLLTTWSPPHGQYVQSDHAFDEVIKQVGAANQVPVVDLALIWQKEAGVVGPAGTPIADFAAWGARDSFHPNQKGHDAIAKALQQAVLQPR